LVFEQEQYPPALIPVALSDVSSTLAFPRLAEHPALAGLDATDLAEWHPDGLVGVREIVKPDRVGFLAVVDSGGANGLETAGLAELRVEGGTILLCQLDVTRKFRVDPAATRVLRNLLTWSATRPAPAAATGVFCDDAAAAQLDSVGLRYDRLAWPLPKGALHRYRALLILDAGEGISEPARVRQFVQEGGRVVLHGLTPRSLPLLEALLGQPIVLREARPPWVTLNDRGGPAAGLSNQELAWFQPAAEAGGTPLVSPGIAEYAVLQPPAVAGRAGPPLTFHAIPGLLVSSPLGRGLWVLDQVRWEKPGGNEAKAKRYLATLLTNLGCEAQP
jgi:hypothetical protein